MGNRILTPVKQVPLTAFNQKYYEVYHSHNWFQSDEGETTATYEVNDDKKSISVVNQQTTLSGEVKTMEGVADFTYPPKNGYVTGSLTVKFDSVPFQPLWAELTGPNYIITKYDQDAGIVVVESPGPGEYMWILSTRKITDNKEKEQIIKRFKGKDKSTSLFGTMFF